jgi:surface antigen
MRISTTRAFPYVVALGLLLTAGGAAYGSGWNALRSAPAAQFNDDDWALLKSAALAVLNDPKAGASKAWNNAKSGHHGAVRFLKSFTADDGRECKQLRFENFADTLQGSTVHSICRTADTPWRLDS